MGYTNNTMQDCNDSNPEINPIAVEIPYDYIDQNCDLYDLSDLDLDGFCDEGYLIENALFQCPKEKGVFGTDCDDQNETINPDSFNPHENCVNDPPKIEPISKISFYENDLVRIIVNALDPENDILNYYINDSRFTNNSNVFYWQTGFEDLGNYSFEITVTDSMFTENITFSLEIKNKKRAPICHIIPSIIFNEDETFNFNINEYCIDPDNDSIFIDIESRPDLNHIENINITENKIEIYPKQNWFGTDYVTFRVSDNENFTLTDEIQINITGINDPPILANNIPDISFDMDSNLTNYINLNDYFLDLDFDNILYNVSGNENINIVIENGSVSFYPIPLWYGNESVNFFAYDGEYLINSNELILNVKKINHKPMFGDIECDSYFFQYEQQSCKLNATDIENENLTYTIVSENHLDCLIENDILTYSSNSNYNGSAFCIIRVSDNLSYNEFNLEVFIENVNDAPVIIDYFPLGSVRVLNNTNQSFIVNATDIDSLYNITWFLNNITVGFGNYFIFNKNTGIYELKAIVSDGELNDTQSWNVYVGEIFDFTCEEVKGNICSDKQICKGDILNVSDTNNCCSISCSDKPPEFNRDIKTCKSINSTLEIMFLEPNNNKKFNLGDLIKGEIEIKNNNNLSLNTDVTFYLYNIKENKKLTEFKTSVLVNKNSTKKSQFKLFIPEDLDTKDSYAIYVKVKGVNKDKENYCNDNYTGIILEKKDYSVKINKINLDPKTRLSCGDSIYLDVEYENNGLKSNNYYIKIENSQLKINKKSDVKTLISNKKYKETFELKIPNNASYGDYILKVTAYNNNSNYYSSEIIIPVENCKIEEEEIKIIDTIVISKINKLPFAEKKNERNIILALNFLFLVLILLFFIIIVIYRSKLRNDAKKNFAKFSIDNSDNYKNKRKKN
jgi:hypothetical protein